MNPLSALFKALEVAGIGLDAEAARDAVWLAPYLMAPPSARDEMAGPDVSTSPPAGSAAPATAGASGNAGADTDVPRTEQPTRRAVSGQPAGAAEPATAMTLTRVQVPRAAGLAGERGVPGALRPLRRKRWLPSAPVDEVETVRRAIEDDLWLPAYQPIAERWLELALVVDRGVSMAVWQDQARVLTRAFTRAAAFRDVREWSLVSEGEDIGVRRRSGRDTASSTPVRRRSPFGGGRRGLVLVITDCVSAGWHDGSVVTLLRDWSLQSPVALLPVLPERLWKRTALADAARVRLRAVTAAAVNSRFHWVADLPLEEAGGRSRGIGVPRDLALFPVVTAAPASLLRLARLVAGVGDDAVDGVMFDTEMMAPLPPAPAMSPQERVRRFWSVSSKAASQLASLLSATPVPSTGLIGLLRRELIPGADASAEAEVLFSGLLRAPVDADSRTGDIPLVFQDDVRPLLLQNAPVDRVLETLRRVSSQTAMPGVSAQMFDTWMANPSSGQAQLRPASDPVAMHMAAVLEQIGGSYARIVHPEARKGSAVQEPTPTRTKPGQAAAQRFIVRTREPVDTPPGTKPVCFVIMGFGMKVDYATNRSLDLDKSYRLLIKPAVESAGFECVRADEIIHSGVIDAPLYEQLLQADLVIADLSTSNPMALYELGVRHGLRPRTTLIMAEEQFRLPFDVGHMVVQRYQHLGSGIDAEEARRVQHALTEAIHERQSNDTVDSPVYVFLPDLQPPAIDETATRDELPRTGGDVRTCFVTMGFGEKADYTTGRTLNLDSVYRHIIKPAVEEAGMRCLRADEIVHSGAIDRPVFDQLLSADVVIADLSTYNANALYELGIRHALRPGSTIVMAEREFRLPFDLPHVSILSYEHLGRDLGFEEVARVRSQLTARLLAVAESREADSPVYVFLRDLEPPSRTPPPEGAESPAADSDAASLSELLDDARRNGDWRAMEEYAERLARLRPADPYPKRQMAMAAYKSRQPDPESSLSRAKSMIEDLHPRSTRDVETRAIWASIHKRLWDLKRNRGDLNEAVEAYRAAFEVGNDVHAGINLAFMLTVRAVEGSDNWRSDVGEAQEVRHRVVEICQRQLSTQEGAAPAERFWTMATLAEAWIGLGNIEPADEVLRRLRAEGAERWMVESVDTQIEKLRALLTRIPGDYA